MANKKDKKKNTTQTYLRFSNMNATENQGELPLSGRDTVPPPL
jgi:hypothetical protein